MTDTKTTKLDTAQRIAAALARTDEPKMTSILEFNPETDVIVAEVPMHLRHLHNLVLEMQNEARESEDYNPLVQAAIDSTFKIFCIALEEFVPLDGDDYSGTKLCTGWKVAGVKRTKDEPRVNRVLHGVIIELG